MAKTVVEILIVKSHRPGTLFAIVSVLAMTVSMLAGANIASADQLQVQSYERASQTATCDSPPESLSEWRASWANPYDPISGPTWHPTWEQWANNGNGGWTCTRSITWARTPVAAGGGGGSVTYALGDIGPGGGLVFLISGGLTYEMAPKTWGVNETTLVAWTTTAAQCYTANSTTADANCQLNNLYPGTAGEQTASTAAAAAVGMGSANTDAIIARMNAGSVASGAYAAGAARAYPGGGYTDWFLPSLAELNAMYTYSRVAGFNVATYGFATDFYWSSSQIDADMAWGQNFVNGDQDGSGKFGAVRVRPIRAF